MAFILKFHPRFADELEDAILYFDSISKSLSLRFRREVKSQLNSIKKNPDLHSIRYDDVRFARIHKFPYAIHYSTGMPEKKVFVHSLLSDHQNPDANWRKRL